MADGSVIIDTELDESGLKTGLAKLGGTVAAGIGAAVTAISGMATAIVNMGMEYEAQMSRVQAISGATADELIELDILAKQLGADTVFSAAEAAAGMENLASAGFSVNEIMGAMPGLLDLAAVSGGDVAEASDVAASTLRAFGLEAKEAAHVADVFARAAADTNAEVTDMGYAMKYIAPVANAMGISIEETAAAIGILADAGIKGTQAGTTLRGALTRLSKPTEKMCEVMDDLGLSFYDSKGNMLSLEAQISMLQKSFEGLTEEEKQYALTTLYGTESLSGMLALIDAGPEKLATLTASFEDCEGSAAEMAEIMMDNLKGAVEDFSGSVETLGLSIYEELQEPLKEAVKVADGYVAELQEAFNEGGIEGVVGALGSVLSDAVNEITEFAPKLIEAGASLLSSLIQGLSENASSLGTAVTGILDVFIESFFTIVNDFVTLGGELILALCNGLSNNAESIAQTIADGLSTVMITIVDYLPLLVNAGAVLLVSIVDGIISALPKLVSTAGTLVLKIVDGIKSGITSILLAVTDIADAIIGYLPVIIEQIVSMLPDFLQLIVDAIVQFVPIILDVATSIVTSLVEMLPDLIVMIIEVLPELIESIVNGLMELLPQIIDCGITLLTSLVAELPTIINTIVMALPSIINEIVETLLDLVPEIVNCGVQLLTSLVQALPDIIYAIVNVLPVIIASIISTIVGLIPLIIECGIDLFVALVAALPQIIQTILAVLPQIVNSIISALLDSIPLIIQCGIDLLVSLIAALPDIIVALMTAAPTIVTSIVTALLDNIPLLVQSGIDLFLSLIKCLPQIIVELVKAVPQILTALLNGFLSGVGSFSEVGKNLLEGLWSGIQNAKDWLVKKLKNLGDVLTDALKSVLGIASPSRRFRDEIGKFLPLGIADGISAEANAAITQVEDLADNLADVDFKLSDPELPTDDIDYDGIIANARMKVYSDSSDVGTAISANVTARRYSESSTADTVSGKTTESGKPEYIQNDIYIDGKKAGRVLTPYIAKQLDWEGK